jgi:lipoic acid synthetase
MILGDICTRSCGFCGVAKGVPAKPDPDEPGNVAIASRKLGLKYVVVTSVTRDDLPDGGAAQFAATITALRAKIPGIKVEVLVPDFKGSSQDLKTVIDADPDVLNHNLEMVPRLYPSIRPRSDYKTSLDLLKTAKNIRRDMTTKSGFMLGLGEKEDEVVSLLKDIRSASCDIVTIGQYISPSQTSVKVVEYIQPEKFDRYRKIALSMGIKRVVSGPFVRSSYKAGQY